MNIGTKQDQEKEGLYVRVVVYKGSRYIIKYMYFLLTLYFLFRRIEKPHQLQRLDNFKKKRNYWRISLNIPLTNFSNLASKYSEKKS
jgi:hypothetical protein